MILTKLWLRSADACSLLRPWSGGGVDHLPAVVGTLPRPNNCPDLVLLCTHHTLRAITTILLAATVNRVTEATML